MEIKTVGVVGCGLMGSGIVELAAKNGYTVVVREVNDDFLKKGLGRVQGSMARGVEKGKLSAADRDAAWARIKGTTALQDLAGRTPFH
jgi:3-hydroxybutyryl-CoA dehydrogenase